MTNFSYSILDNDLIKAIKTNEDWAINHLYVKYKADAISYIKAKGADDEEALTCYHETIMIVIEHVREGLLDSNSGSILPYLKSVGRIQWLNVYRSNQTRKARQEQYCSGITESEEDILNSLIRTEHDSWRLVLLKKAMSELKEKCKKIISLTILQIPPLRNEDIASLVGLSNANTVGVTKSRCLTQLKNIFFEYYSKQMS